MAGWKPWGSYQKVCVLGPGGTMALILIFFTWKLLQDRIQGRPDQGREEMPLSLESLLKPGNQTVIKWPFVERLSPEA